MLPRGFKMEAFVLPKTIVYLFLSLSNPTTLYFDEPVEYVQAGKTGDTSLVRSSNKKVLVIQPLKTPKGSNNMVILTKNHHFNFKYEIVDKAHHDFVYIHEGKENTSYVKKYEDENVKLLEGSSSVYIVNKGKTPVSVNSQELKKAMIFSKGLPIFIDNKRIAY
jgi:hypothetical protein